MGKSFNDDVFNNGFNLDSINGLSISQEAIEENKKSVSDKTKEKTEKDIKSKMLDDLHKDMEKTLKETSLTDGERDLLEDIIKEHNIDLSDTSNNALNYYKDVLDDNIEEEQQPKKSISNMVEKALYTKKTMIFKQEYLDIIDGLASINDMQIKDVLNQLLEKAINELDQKTKEKAIKEAHKNKTTNKTDKSIF